MARPDVADFTEQLADADDPQQAANEILEDEIESFAQRANEVAGPDDEPVTEEQAAAYMEESGYMDMAEQALDSAIDSY
jgi:hypothetical protein